MTDLPAPAIAEPSPPPVIDARGLRCPAPVIRLARRARSLPAGSVLQVLADDPAAQFDIPAWCRMKGHAVDLADEGDHTAYRVLLGQPKST